MKRRKSVLMSMMLVIAVFMSACSTTQTENTKKNKKSDKNVEEVQTETKAPAIVESTDATTEASTTGVTAELITEATTETSAEPTTEETTTTEATTETTTVSEETTTEAPPQSDCNIIFDITYNENIALAKYTVVLYLDDIMIDSIEHGKFYLQKVGTKTGDHEIRFEKRGDPSCATVLQTNITGDSTLIFELTSHLAEIEINSSRKMDGLEDIEVEMPNVTEVRLDRARDILKAAGFKNITVESNKVIIIESNWVVINQNIPAGALADRSAEIVIFCEKDG